MQVIYKYAIDPYTVLLDLPEGAQPLHAGEQGGHIFLWALVDPNRPPYTHEVLVMPTGAPFPEEQWARIERSCWIQTVQMADGLVFHVFLSLNPDNLRRGGRAKE